MNKEMLYTVGEDGRHKPIPFFCAVSKKSYLVKRGRTWILVVAKTAIHLVL